MFPVQHTRKHEYLDIYIKCHMASWHYIASARRAVTIECKMLVCRMLSGSHLKSIEGAIDISAAGKLHIDQSL